MNKNKLVKWSGALIITMTLGLTGCYLDGTQNYQQEVDMSDQTMATVQTTTGAEQGAQKSKDPVQKSTPGPKRAAAPQIPVIQ